MASRCRKLLVRNSPPSCLPACLIIYMQQLVRMPNTISSTVLLSASAWYSHSVELCTTFFLPLPVKLLRSKVLAPVRSNRTQHYWHQKRNCNSTMEFCWPVYSGSSSVLSSFPSWVQGSLGHCSQSVSSTAS